MSTSTSHNVNNKSLTVSGMGNLYFMRRKIAENNFFQARDFPSLTFSLSFLLHPANVAAEESRNPHLNSLQHY
jgi:hypothetical protein